MDSATSELETIPVARRAVGKRKAAGGRKLPWLRGGVTLILLLAIVISAPLDVGVGSYSALSLGPVTIACPLGVAQVIAATRQIAPVLALGGLASVLLIVIFGRVFCGWLCPARWAFNRGPNMAARPWRRRAWIQTGVVAGVIGLAAVCQTPVFCVVCPVGAVCRGAIAAGTGGSLWPALGWLSAAVGVEWLSGRSWCRDLCPLGALTSRLSKLNPFFKPRSDPTSCHPCVVCARACPEGLSLHKDADLSTCTKCLNCTRVCPQGAAKITLF
jgi:ferredoxin-type protein NapH